MREVAYGAELSIQEEVELLRSAVRYLGRNGVEPAGVGLVLGSGLRGFAERLIDPLEIPLHEVHEFPKVRVRGQGGSLVQGRLGDTLVHCLTGRVHLYEGYSSWEVVRAVRTLALLGTPTFLLTNAAGGIRDDLVPGSLMLILDHVNLTARNPLAGPHHEALGPRFPAMNEVYDAAARKLLRSSDPGEGLREGTYAQVLGPSYETPAEIRMVRALGGDAVGMSTVPEAIALHALGCRVAALSVVTNRAAGLTAVPPSHEEVLHATELAAERFEELLARALPELGALGKLRGPGRRGTKAGTDDSVGEPVSRSRGGRRRRRKS